MDKIVRMHDLTFDKSLFETFESGTIMDSLLSSYSGLPKGVHYMIIGDPGTGKTTILLDFLANVMQKHSKARILFISAEMNEIDLAIYVHRFPKFSFINILFIESQVFEEKSTHNWATIMEIVHQGWDIIAIDSFYELQGIIKEEEDITMKEAESYLLSLMKKNNKAINLRKKHTTFISIQQVTKSGTFIGSNRLKHSISAMMELRLDNPKNIYSERYIVFSKHRRGDVGVKLYYNLATTGDVEFDLERFENDIKIRNIRNNLARDIRKSNMDFDELFSTNVDY